MEYKKNDKIELNIIDITKEGLGLAKKDGIVFFVKDGILGDSVIAIITKVTKNIIYAKVLDIIVKSEYRVVPKCSVCNSCGGCQILSLNYEKQLNIKKKFVVDALRNIGKFSEDEYIYTGIFGMEEPYNFRNKMQVPYAVVDNKIIYGFYAGRTHHIIPFENCLAGFYKAELILNIIKTALQKFNISIYDEKNNRGIFREVMLRKGNVSDEISITYIINDKSFDSKKKNYQEFDEYIRKSFNDEILNDETRAKKYNITTSTININTNATNVLFGNKNSVLYGKGYIEDSIGNVKFYISPESFYQVNALMTKVLYDKVVEFAEFDKKENVIDLYCGIGTISLYIAKYVNAVLGIEVIDRAVSDAKLNAELNHIENADFLCADVDELYEKESNTFSKIERINNRNIIYDTIIVDPPRKGLSYSLIEFIKHIKPKKIIYVSCDPATLARDLDILCHEEKLYRLEKISNVDMFPHTMHIETIARVVLL